MNAAPHETEACISWLATAMKQCGAVAMTFHADSNLFVLVMPDTIKAAQSPLDLVSWLEKNSKPENPS